MPISANSRRATLDALPECHFGTRSQYRVLTIGAERFFMQTTTRVLTLESAPVKVIELRKPAANESEKQSYANSTKGESR
jgi:hypothetical protein